MRKSIGLRLMKLPYVYKPLKRLREWVREFTPAYERQFRGGLLFYGQFVQKGDLCFDIGANIGNRTGIFLALGAKVVAVEPQEDCVLELHRKFRADTNLVIEQAALGQEIGSGEMWLSQAETISSMSMDWIQRVKQSGRFKDYQWNRVVKVKIRTLDSLIAQYGIPRFCKIDVEGYESSVIKGLSLAIPGLSFEFTPEYLETAFDCIQHLAVLGNYEYNLSLGESLQLACPSWSDVRTISKLLTDSVISQQTFGDVYARLAEK